MRRFLFLAFLVSATCLPAAGRAQQTPPTVFAAASMTNVLQDIDKLWVAAGHPAIRFNFAASSTLARQMEQGAEVDVFISADERWMDWAAERGLIVPDTRTSPLGNALVLVAAKPDPVALADLPRILGEARIASGDPAHVPAGRYAQQALTALGLWDALSPRLALAESVRGALLLVERGEAPYGIVYATDAAVAPALHVVATFPADSHTPITYPFAIATRPGQQRNLDTARALLAFLTGPEARAIYQRAGFAIRSAP